MPSSLCKGNLAVLRKSLKLARDDPKRIYKNNIYKQGLDTTDLARDDPKRIYKNNIYKQGLDTTDLARDDPKRILRGNPARMT